MPRLPQVNLPAPSLPRRASPGDFGAQSAAASASLARPLEIVGDIAAQIEIGRANAQRARVEAEYGAELANLSRSLPDSAEPPERWEELFTEGASKLREQHREALLGGARGQFEQNAEIAAQRELVVLRDQIRGKQQELGREDTAGAVQQIGLEAARSQGAELDRLRGEIAQAVASSVAAGFHTQDEGRSILVASEQQIAIAAVERFQNENPALGAQMLRDRSGPFANMDESTRQRSIANLERTARQNDAFERAREEEARQAEKRQREELEDETRKNGLFQAASGELTVDWIQQNRDNMSASSIKELLGALKSTKQDLNDIPDLAAYYRLVSMQAKAPAQFAQAEIDPARLGYAKAAQLIEAQQKIRQGAGETPASLNATLNRWLDTIDVSDSQKARLYDEATAEVLQFQKQNGRQANDKEMREIRDDIVRRRIIDNWWFDDTVIPADQAAPPAFTQVPGVPSEHLEAIRATLQRKGIPDTPDNVRALWEQTSRSRQ